MMAVTASESLNLLQSNPDILTQCRDNIRAMKAQLDPRSDWVICTSAMDNPIMLLVLKPEVVKARKLGLEDQERILLDCVEEVSTTRTATLLTLRVSLYRNAANADSASQTLANGVLITLLKTRMFAHAVKAKDGSWFAQPALKVCVTSALSKKDIEKAGVTIRHAITKVMTRKSSKVAA